ncbi:MAG: excinuclease ABC subunit A, partial [Bryocella sp.]
QTGKTLYLLDEPTTGLHFDDVRKLLEVLHRLTDLGNTVMIIEHNIDIIRNADYVIDMGPEGGEGGGSIVAQGPPEIIAREPLSHTGQFLARYYDSTGIPAAQRILPPIELPDLEKKVPRPKFIKPEKKTGVPTASKNKPTGSARPAKKATAKSPAKAATKPPAKAAKKSARKS